MQKGPSFLLTHLLIALLCLIWGSTWWVIKQGLLDLPPFTSAGVRFAVAAAMFAALAPWLSSKEGGAAPPGWLSLAVGTLTFGVPYAIVYRGETLIPSGLAAVLWAIYPLLVAVCGQFFLPGERLTAGRWAGFVLSFTGVAILFLTDLRGLGPGAISMGAVFLLSPFVSAIGTIVVKRHGKEISSVLLNRNGLLIGAFLLLAAAGLLERNAAVRWTGPALSSILYLAGVGTVVSFGLFHWLLRYVPAHRLSLISFVIPVVALALGAVLGHEQIGARTLAGSALVLAGVGLVARRDRSSPRPETRSRATLARGPSAPPA